MNKLSNRFDELEKQAITLERSKMKVGSLSGPQMTLDGDHLIEWSIKVKTLLRNACGEDSEHYKMFVRVEGVAKNYLDKFHSLNAVFRAAKEDYNGGYLTTVRNLVQAELFDTELEQATELLESGYKLAAAVIAGVVLETGLRELSERNDLPHAVIDKMNTELARKGVYGKLIQKQVTALAHIRNSAAHGKPDEFDEQQVEGMIRNVGDFLVRHLT